MKAKRITQTQSKKTIYELFRISIWINILSCLGEMLAGLATAFIPSTLVLSAAVYFSQTYGGDVTHDFLAQIFIHAAHLFVVSNDLLIGLYIFVRGLVQLIPSLALLRNKLWAYPVMICILLVLVVAQIYAIYLSHSVATGIVTIIDIITIYLVWHEYTLARSMTKKASN